MYLESFWHTMCSIFINILSVHKNNVYSVSLENITSVQVLSLTLLEKDKLLSMSQALCQILRKKDEDNKNVSSLFAGRQDSICIYQMKFFILLFTFPMVSLILYPIDLSESERDMLKSAVLNNLDGLTLVCLNMGFFGFMILGVHLASCFCKFLSFIKFVCCTV